MIAPARKEAQCYGLTRSLSTRAGLLSTCFDTHFEVPSVKLAQTSADGRAYGLTDRLIMALDGALKGASPHVRAGVHNPGVDVPDTRLPPAERRRSAAMMRVNHTGEVCAQALYSAQAVWSTEPGVRSMLEHAAAEETAHLLWCAERLAELDSHPSRLDPLWFAGAYTIGSSFAVLGDEWSMGFLDETERQVVEHLEDHLAHLPRADRRSAAILSQMQRDEARHAATAVRHGARRLPLPVRLAMKAQAAVMKFVAARI
jgi:ubiquinone biosynthesis monooxygenase Coq7